MRTTFASVVCHEWPVAVHTAVFVRCPSEPCPLVDEACVERGQYRRTTRDRRMPGRGTERTLEVVDARERRASTVGRASLVERRPGRQPLSGSDGAEGCDGSHRCITGVLSGTAAQENLQDKCSMFQARRHECFGERWGSRPGFSFKARSRASSLFRRAAFLSLLVSQPPVGSTPFFLQQLAFDTRRAVHRHLRHPSRNARTQAKDGSRADEDWLRQAVSRVAAYNLSQRRFLAKLAD